MSSFVPPTYARFGKNYKDLTKKKYDFAHTLKTVNKAPNGVTFESGLLKTDSGLHGLLKAKFSSKQYEVEVESGTCPSAETKAAARFPSVQPGLNVNASFSTADCAFKGQGYSTEVEYSTSNFSTVQELKTNGERHFLKSSAVVGFEGLSIGGQLSADLSNGSDLVDYNLGVEYAQPDYTATLFTEKKFDVANFAYFYKVSGTQQVGALARVELSGQHNATMTVAQELAVNPSTTLKSKVEIPSRLISVALEHRLASPQVSVNVAGTFSPCELVFGEGVKAQTFGFGLTFGDY